MSIIIIFFFTKDTICPKPEEIPENYYEKNRNGLLSLLMPDIARNDSLSTNIYSYEFVQNLDDLLRRINRNLIPLLNVGNTSKVQVNKNCSVKD